MNGIRFDEANHLYFYNDLWVPGLTHTLRSAGVMGDMRGGSTAAMDRGTWVHRVLPLLESGRLTMAELGRTKHAGYCRSWFAWRKSRPDLEIEDWELLVFDPAMWVATHVDIIALDPDRGRGVIDAKSGLAHPWHRLQTAAAVAMVPGARWRAGIYLYADGSPGDLIPHTGASDHGALRGICASMRWKIEHGLESAPYVGQEVPA